MVERLRPADAGHNLTADVFLELFRDARDAEQAKDAGVAKGRKIRQRMENAGVNLKAYDLAMALRKKDADEATKLLRDALRYSSWLGLPVGAQASLGLNEPPLPAPSPEAARKHTLGMVDDDGYAAGKTGRMRQSNPHEPGTEEHARWDVAWLRGQEVLAMGPEKKGKPDGAAVGRRGRGRRRGGEEAMH